MSATPRRTYQVRVGKDELRFAAAHFITFGREGVEPLHGHNYRVRVTLAGQLNRSGYVFDFVQLKALVREILGPWDHTVLLPTRNPRIDIEEEAGAVTVRCGERTYAFPRSDVTLLPVANTTAELLAERLADRLLERLAESWPGDMERLAVELEEAPGQSAVCRRDWGQRG